MYSGALINTLSWCLVALTYHINFHVFTSAENVATPKAIACKTKPCCFRGRNVCSGLKITLKGEAIVCDAVIKNKPTLENLEFFIDNAEHLTSGHYTVLLIDVDLQESLNQYENASVIYAAFNIPSACFRKQSGCSPTVSVPYKPACPDEDFDHIDKIHLFLLRQKIEMDITELPDMSGGTYPYSEFYRGTLWYKQVVRCNRYLWHRCVHHSKYDVYLRTEIEDQHERILAYEDKPSNQINNKLLEYFESVIVTPKMVKFEKDTCFLVKFLESTSSFSLSLEESFNFGLVNCSDGNKIWELYLEKLHDNSFREKMMNVANAWYVHAMHHYVHLRMFKQFSTTYPIATKDHSTDFVSRKVACRTQKTTRMVARLQLLFEGFQKTGHPWDPPKEHFRALEQE
ncbi:hypothetical protein FBUS_02096 [Fasciolopsis buskii]|uniref:Uncharacterized protein n=1 Tax=Fasciolopsis buskii TaxID=27845 RepID=A0A8E0VI33_9TREM|nr:hypothetical protein FBUS_02096 [Fasciolopsis buski]